MRAAAAAPSRRQLSRWQREQRQQRTLYIAIGALAVLVLAILAGGLIYDRVVRANQVVAQVGPDSITASQLVAEMQPEVRQIDAQAKQAGAGANVAQYVDQQKRGLPDQVLSTLIDKRLIQQEADRRGIVVTSEDVDDKERQTVAQVSAAQNPTPAPTVAPTDASASAADATPVASPSPTVAGTPTPVPTLDTTAYGPALQQLLDNNNLTEADLRDTLQSGLLRDRVQAAIGQDQVPDTQEQIHARHIVVAAQDQANDVLQQLQNGADFAQLASQYSTDTSTKDKGGDLGWLPRGIQDKAFDDAAFALQAGQLSNVVADAGSYQIIQVLERDPSRAVAPDQLQTLRSKAFNDWLSSARSSPDVKLQLSQSERDWVLARIGIRP
ncbi:MAG: peptidylprolyl isomerase [Chloroflexi bacterium]|nr:peptidylprolyl isomerase [Chloroflexota bacterium]